MIEVNLVCLVMVTLSISVSSVFVTSAFFSAFSATLAVVLDDRRLPFCFYFIAAIDREKKFVVCDSSSWKV